MKTPPLPLLFRGGALGLSSLLAGFILGCGTSGAALPGGNSGSSSGGHAGSTSAHGGHGGQLSAGGQGGGGGMSLGIFPKGGGSQGCGLVTCASAKANCGAVGDGCGSTIDCGTCTAPEICGGAMPNVCGLAMGSGCIPKTCTDLGFTCGPAGDGCGGMLQCGSCMAPDSCGGGGKPSVCGGGGQCTNLCMQQMACSTGATTTVSGTVFAPTPKQYWGPPSNGPDPIYNAVVYIPNAPLKPFAQGASCQQCGSDVSGDPLVLTHSAPDGTFQLQNVPVGSQIPLVIQIGKWRRQVMIDVKPCSDNPLTQEQTRLPRDHTEGDIPQIAISTGSADALECVFRKIGITDQEFTLPANHGGKGRVQIFQGNGASDSTGSAPPESELEGNPLALSYFDMVVFDCQGSPSDESAYTQNVINYANAGGRVFASHYSYDWLYNAPPFSTTADWSNPDGPQPNSTGNNSVTGIIDQSFPKGAAFAKWLDVVGASIQSGSGTITINTARADLPSTKVTSAVAQRWIYSDNNDPQTVQHYTFNTPVGPLSPAQCGRVLFSDFHVSSASGGGNNFPDECDNAPMSPQEKVLEFMLFDLSSCVETHVAPMCSQTSCKALGYSCGPAGDGCGGLLDCGTCQAPQTCGGGGVSGVCGMNGGICKPLSCADLKYQCGPAGDGCGGTIQCGTCQAPKTCGGGGLPGQCGGTGIQ